MANRYWGGGTGGWNTTNTANWYSDLARTTLAGAVPTAADDVFFDNLSNVDSYTCTLSTTPVCRSLSISPPPVDYSAQFSGPSTIQPNLKVPSSAFNFGAGSFTVEFFLNQATLGNTYDQWIGQWGTYSTFQFSNLLNKISMQIGTNPFTGPPMSTMSINTFNHIAYVYDGTTYAVYVNGTRYVMTGTAAAITPSASALVGIGAVVDQTGYGTGGKIKQLRVTKAVRYTGSTITVPSSYLTGASDPYWSSVSLLLPLQNSIIDISSNAYTVINNGVTFVTPNVTIAGSAALAISGSLAIASTGVTRTYTGPITFKATTTGWTISAGVSLAGITFNGVGGGWTLTAALTCNLVTITAGAFNTAGFALTAIEIQTAAGSLIRSLSLGSSVVTLSSNTPIGFGGGTFTFNAGTSTINLSFDGTITSFGGYTFYDVNFTSTILSAFAFNQATTFNNLSFASKSAIGVIRITLYGNLTVNGTLTFPTPTTLGSSRYFILSNTYGTTRTLTAATVALTDVDFQDITGAGAASWTGTRLGNAQGNSNITFDTPKTVYWNLVTGGLITGLGWALSSGGTPSRDNFPLPQDTMTFVNTGLNTSATVTLVTGYNISGIDCNARTLAMALATVANNMYGSITLSTAVTTSGTGILTFQNRGEITITSAGRTFSQQMIFNGIGGTYKLNGAWTISNLITLTYGTLSLVTYTFTSLSISLGGSTVRALDFGTAGIMVGSWDAIGTSNLTTIGTSDFRVNVGTAITIYTSQSANFLPNIKIFAGTSALTLQNNYYVGSLDFTGYAGAVTYTNSHIYGNLTLSSGMTITSLQANFEGTANQTIASNGKTLSSVIIRKTGAGVLSLVDNLAVAAAFTTTSGNFDAANQNISATVLTSTGTVARSLTMGSGTWTLTSTGTVWDFTTATGMTLNANTSTINLTNTTTTARTFAGGGLTYNNLVIGGATGISTLTFTGSNTFAGTISSTKIVAHTILFTAGTTTTVADWTVRGTAGNVVTIGSATASSHNLVKTGAAVTSDYLSISRSNASPINTWYAGTNSINTSNNTGWLFTSPPIKPAFFLMF